MTRLQPNEGQWYTLRDSGQMIYVINVDADHEVIDIQDFDGDIDELGFDEWRELDLELAAAPEDSSVVLDARMPSLSSFLPTANPGNPRSTMNAVIPL